MLILLIIHKKSSVLRKVKNTFHGKHPLIFKRIRGAGTQASFQSHSQRKPVFLLHSGSKSPDYIFIHHSEVLGNAASSTFIRAGQFICK